MRKLSILMTAVAAIAATGYAGENDKTFTAGDFHYAMADDFADEMEIESVAMANADEITAADIDTIADESYETASANSNRNWLIQLGVAMQNMPGGKQCMAEYKRTGRVSQSCAQRATAYARKHPANIYKEGVCRHGWVRVAKGRCCPKGATFSGGKCVTHNGSGHSGGGGHDGPIFHGGHNSCHGDTCTTCNSHGCWTFPNTTGSGTACSSSAECHNGESCIRGRCRGQ
ncbi:MAG: hypothetical protein WC421_04660 [Elusimicrobiales bacterium]